MGESREANKIHGRKTVNAFIFGNINDCAFQGFA